MSSRQIIEGLSGIVTTFNDSSAILAFLENIYSQTAWPEELLIVDGGSMDDTVSKIEEYNRTSDINITIVNDGQRLNISEGLNAGIKKSSHKWLLILGTGNYYEPNFVEELWNAKGLSNSLVFYSNVLGIDKTEFAKVFNQYFLNGNSPFDWEPSNHGVLIAREVFIKHGLFWEHFHYAGEDSEFFKRITDSGVFCEYVDSTSVYWETPKSWKEFLKKMEVNAIAEWQIFPTRIIVFKAISFLFLAIIAILIMSISCYSIFGFILLTLVLAAKKRTRNLWAISLGLSARYIGIYYHFRNKRFASRSWALTTSKLLKK